MMAGAAATLQFAVQFELGGMLHFCFDATGTIELWKAD